MKTKFKSIFIMYFLGLVSLNAFADKSSAIVGAYCDQDGSIHDFTDKRPLMCVNKKWQTITFKRSNDGSAIPLTYTGKASLYAVDSYEQYILNIDSGSIADIKLPEDYLIELVVTDNPNKFMTTSYDWIKNIVLIKANSTGKSKLWVYARNNKNELNKFSIQLVSN